MMSANTWKLQDAKAQVSEVVRRARAGEPQEVTVHGKKAVAVVDLARFEVRPKPATAPRTMAEFVEMSKKYRGAPLEIPPRTKMVFRDKSREIFDDEPLEEPKE
jgi:prevent-host-death family protein